MASIRSRTRRDGTSYWQVLYRNNSRQSSLSFDDEKPAIRFKALVEKVGPDRAEATMSINRADAGETTLTQWCTEHIDKLTGIEGGTIEDYRRYLRRDIEGDIGDLPLSAVDEDAVAAWVKTLKRKGNGGKTIANKHGFLSSAMKSAVRAGKVTTNPCEGTRLPAPEVSDDVFLTKGDVAKLIDGVPEEWRLFTRWLVATGMRFGEATAITVGDIDKAAGTARINKAWKYTGTSASRLSIPKSKKSRRTINVPASVIDELDLTRPKSELLFPDPDRGGRITHARFRTPFRKGAELLDPRPTPHDMRHTCASWMVQAGIPLPVVQAHLGHESITTTIAVYTHIDRSQAALAADAIGEMLG